VNIGRASGWSLAFLLTSLGGQGLALSAFLTMSGLFAFSYLQGDTVGAQFAAWSGISSLGILLALFPGTYWGLQSVLGRPEPAPGRFRRAWLAAAILLPLGLVLGTLAFRDGGLGLTLTLGSLAHLLTTLSVTVLLTTLALRQGPPVSGGRAVAAFTMGLTAIPLVAIVFEIAVLLPVSLLAGLWLIGSQEGTEILQSFISAGADPTALNPDLLLGWLQRPAVVAGVFAFTAGIVPCIEEIVKTAGVWRFLRRGLPAGQAFLMGALAGTGYGLFEALFLSQPGPEWTSTAVGRIGASLMHAATAGLTSWGLMEWARDRRWGRALGAYAAAVLGHASWNAAALSTGFDELIRSAGAGQPAGPSAIGVAANLILIGLSLAAFLLIARRRGEPNEPVEVTPPA
jgi:PrsW family intramembrane metalloprotease